ncbi:MAG: 1-(5-phosphoribosyl)-5-((5-phosphoribosylamino)methylideneamino)imidazole-4-carboxamide isomerase, partial [Clostridia bacterium]|nr:1-(5-phosphoribosyl)-5-((5-phosphoribosylamino)methylideneamino)imidazole-4-carboxamide isomerase [Clostridia bacterium]
GGIRTPETAEKYIESGIDRVIFGTSAVKNTDILRDAVRLFGDRIAVSVDVRNGIVAASGWEEDTGVDLYGFCREIQSIGVRTVICTDISRDGAMKGSNRELYGSLSEKFGFDIIASGGISSLDDVKSLSALGLYGAIIGKAYYTGAVSLAEAIKIAE